MKKAFLTGCNGQLGTAISSFLTSNGILVNGFDLHEKTTNPHLATYFSGSVCNKSELQKWFTSFCCDGDSFSLINNAGVAVFSPSEERTYEEFRFVSDINIWGPILSTTLFIDSLSSLTLAVLP